MTGIAVRASECGVECGERMGFAAEILVAKCSDGGGCSGHGRILPGELYVRWERILP